MFEWHSLASLWKSAQKLASNNQLQSKASSPKKSEQQLATIAALLEHPLVLHLVASTMEKTNNVSMFLMGTNYPYETHNSRSVTIDSNDSRGMFQS